MSSETAQKSSDEDSLRTMNAKKSVQDQLELDMQAFLSKGGTIEQVEINLSTDPPIKPTSKYGGGPI